jgi:two-component system, cell cycle sensor histidine kinase and response regulator CckA
MRGRTETILLAEDEPLVRSMVVTVLRDQGYNVLETTNGAEALQVAQEHSAGEIQLLLSDIVMPGMNGIELARRFRDLFPGVRILLMSGYTDELDLRGALPDPSIEFLPKPFSPQELAEKVRQVLEPGN